MRSISKYFAAAVAATALASCSDDLGISSNGLTGNADMVASLETSDDAFTRMAVKEAGTNAYGGAKQIVWSSNDKIRVFTLDKLSQDIYKLASGEGTGTAEFTRIQSTGLTGDKYAITEADMVYGVSAAEVEANVVKPRLTLTLPTEYEPGKDGAGNVKFPVPFWGTCEVTSDAEDAKINTSLKGLTAYLRVNVPELPAGTKYIVMTTHGGNIYKEDEGFLLAPFGTAVEDTKDWWYAKDLTSGEYTNAQWITGGYSEALSGTLNCILEDGAQLAVDSRLVHSDELRVKIPADFDGVFYVPIVAGEYRNLHVIAASAISSTYKYCYAGAELTVFQDFTALRNKCYYLNMNLVDVKEACIGDINQIIAQTNTTTGVTTLISVDKLFFDAHADDEHYGSNNVHKGYFDDQIEFTGKGNVILNIKEIGENKQVDRKKNNASYIKDPIYGTSANLPLLATDKEKNSKAVAQDAQGFNQFFNINVPSNWAETDARYLKVNTGKTDAVIGTVDGGQAQDVTVDVFGSATRFKVTHHDIFAEDLKIKDEAQAAIEIVAGFQNVTIAKGTKGDVHVYTNGLQAQQETEILDSLNIATTEGIGIRLDDALVNGLYFSEASADRNLYSTGSSAIKKVAAGLGANAVAYAAPATAANTPSHVNMRSYWTGKALSPHAIGSGYDVPVIWTTAQLASVGEGIYPTNTASNHSFDVNEVAPTVNSYSIPKALMRMMWLGAKAYPWIGARVRTGDFTIDGEGVELKNMNFLTNWNGATTYVDDPHWCCTSCWTPNQNTPQIDLSKYVGLFRSINAPYRTVGQTADTEVPAGAVKITNINLQDVELDYEKANTKLTISYVGGISGYVNATTLEATDNVVGEAKIKMKGDHIGGMFGGVDASAKATIKNNEVFGLDNASGYVESAASYAGGIAGELISKGADVEENNVILAGNIVGKSNAGGLFGFADETDVLKTISNKVKADNISSKGNYAAGLIARLNNTASCVFIDNEVEATKITAEDKFAAGFVGQSNLGAANKYARYTSGKVTVNRIQANNGFVGGVVGQADLGETRIGAPYGGVENTERDYITEITVGTLAGKYAVGGIIGNNARSMKSPLNVILGESNNADPDTEINYVTAASIAITAYENTKKEADFAVEEVQYFGTMSNILGYMQDDLTITGEQYLGVVDNLQSEMKEKVLYKKHRDQDHNDIDINKQPYWGDTNGYVGWRATGTYMIDGKQSLGEQLQSANKAPSHNMFKDKDTRYSETSKLVQE